jgi:hypothetical protein
MAKKHRYHPLKVNVTLERDQRSSWKWDERTIQGTEHVYNVDDGNFDRLKRWQFAVRVPKENGQIIVQPVNVPGKAAFAGLQRRSITFQKATKHPFRSKRYCKLNLADPTGEKNRRSTRRGQRDALPNWFQYFRPHMRLKDTVTTTAARDGKAQVIVVPADDYRRMIRLYFALRVWIMQEGVIVE